MPYVKNYRKRTYRRKRPTYRRKTYRRTGYRKNSNKGKMPTYLFKRNVELLNVPSDVVDTFGSYTFTLADLPDFAEFSAMFQMYRINMVKVSFIPLSSATTAGVGADGYNTQSRFANRLFTIIDKNDSIPPTSMDQMRQDSTLKWSPNNRIHKRIIYPKLVSGVTQSSGTVILASYNVSGNPWVNTVASSADAPYFGLKWGLEASVANPQAYRVEATYYLQFKQTA